MADFVPRNRASPRTPLPEGEGIRRKKYEIHSFGAIHSHVARHGSFGAVGRAQGPVRSGKVIHTVEDARWYVASHGDHGASGTRDGERGDGRGLASRGFTGNLPAARNVRAVRGKGSGSLRPSHHHALCGC